LTKTRIEDNSNDRGYFTIMPRIVRAMARTPYDLAFYETVKEIAGETGECYLDTGQIATLAKMSRGKAHACRKYWIGLGFMTGEIVKNPGYIHGVYHLRLTDIWPDNFVWTKEHLDIPSRLEHAESLSVHVVNRSPGELTVSPGERKYNSKNTSSASRKKTPRSEEKRYLEFPPDPRPEDIIVLR
jgi:hypothetical protein